MAKLRGTGMAAVNYPTGMNLGGDPSQALIHATTTGNFIISLSSTDLGQGLKTVIAQIAAEKLGVPFENVLIDTADSDTGPHCMGTFASRATHRVGNAVIAAAAEAREALLEVAAEELEAAVADLETDGQGLMLNVYPSIDSLHMAWFTYDLERPSNQMVAQIGEPGHRWLTAFGGLNGADSDMTITRTEGGIF
ncbi:MAG: molybdopterin-dependent oxidoreductase, partial [Anaerolineae bacterium]|nr:molybdopterin-dependent oxidoreductase [Anaerolineae bacterium]